MEENEDVEVNEANMEYLDSNKHFNRRTIWLMKE
jgi:hypothetical protein